MLLGHRAQTISDQKTKHADANKKLRSYTHTVLNKKSLDKKSRVLAGAHVKTGPK